MTTFRAPAVPAPAPAAGAPLAVPPSCRVSILAGESHQIDLVLPAAAPLSTLLEPTVVAINKVLRGRGAPELPSGAYEFARAAGMTALASDVSLSGHNILDGEVLVLVPAGTAERYGPVVENVSTALAQYASDHFVRVSARDALAVGVAITGAALAVAAGLVWRLRWTTDFSLLVVLLFGGATLALLLAAGLCARLRAGRVATDGAAWAALAAAVLTGAVLPPGGSPGAPHAFLAAVTALAGTWLLVRLTHRYWSAAAAIMTAGTFAGVAAGVRLFWQVPGQRIAVVALIAALVALAAAPAVALTLAKVPRQTFGSITGRDIFARAPGQPEDTISPVEDGPPADVTLTGDQVAAAARRSNTVLTGVLLGIAAVVVPASLIAVEPHGDRHWAHVTIVGVIAVILILRARAFRDRRHAIILVAAAAAAMIGTAARDGLAADAANTAAALIAGGAALGVAAAGLVAATVVPPRIFSPPVRKVVEYSEYILLALVVPFAAWAIGLLQYIRYH
ncbi:type VII secretion integral membrane protein EccD [Mycobacterium sp. MYCO198283]|uniref:type VII secretion integral membrane protein EccD n=1 Tax=Mycobacterium sp. MYCO198283 TaxID=2883505 RepID=UPI001E4F2E46|nr:type VII secretion integral membrane protein EccD [Mycobacterium sp. MYCO198283]MCG5433051.1 type VII secretion integral membrane protein EccD [Mycobacterium sp. MYCO198283]